MEPRALYAALAESSLKPTETRGKRTYAMFAPQITTPKFQPI
jgi:hypothetical protein